MYEMELNIRGIRRERAARRERRNTGKSKELSAQAVYAAAQTRTRKAKESKHVVR